MADIPECPLRVKSGHVQRKKACPLYPQKRTGVSLSFTVYQKPLGDRHFSLWRR